MDQSTQSNLQMPNRLINLRFLEDQFPKTRIKKVKTQPEVKSDEETNARAKLIARQRLLETTGTAETKEEETREENDLNNFQLKYIL
jgi:hypothetical protein